MAAINVGISEWMWRFIALMMLFTLSWTSWVLYQISAPPLVLMAAFQPLTHIKPLEEPSPNRSAQGAISFPTCCEEPQKSAATAALPAPDPARSTPPATKPDNYQIISALEIWAKAWSAKDVAAYLDCYATNFKVPGGETRAQWEKGRRQRILGPKSITVGVDAPSISVLADDRVKITFRQSYQSDIVKPSVTTKSLIMVNTDGRWLIQQEIVGN